MAEIRIICVVKTGTTHETITQPGDERGHRWSKAGVIDAIESHQHVFYTLEGGKRAGLRVVRGPNGKYVQTYADGQWTNNLLELTGCR